jgi:hypothetical protein
MRTIPTWHLKGAKCCLNLARQHRSLGVSHSIWPTGIVGAALAPDSGPGDTDLSLEITSDAVRAGDSLLVDEVVIRRG